jgi:hypothetical protein
MASNADAAYVEELDVDQELGAHLPSSTPPHPGENVPLLSSSTHDDYGSADGDGDGDGSGRRSSELEWPGEADFVGLPWWRRPSVGGASFTASKHSLVAWL